MVFSTVSQGLVLVGGDSSDFDGDVWELKQHEIPPDFDADCDVDLSDLAAFQQCFGSDRRARECLHLDSDSTGDIGLPDFAELYGRFTGPSSGD